MQSKIVSMFGRAIYTFIVLSIILGVIYPLITTGVSKALFADKANGSLVTNADGVVVGSELIGQDFYDTTYFKSRPQVEGNDYDAMKSGGSNLGPNNKKLHELIENRRTFWQEARAASGAEAAPVPFDLLTSSGSNLDPHISLDAALYQMPIVAHDNKLEIAEVEKIIMAHVEKPFMTNTPYVNVLKLNLDLENYIKSKNTAK